MNLSIYITPMWWNLKVYVHGNQILAVWIAKYVRAEIKITMKICRKFQKKNSLLIKEWTANERIGSKDQKEACKSDGLAEKNWMEHCETTWNEFMHFKSRFEEGWKKLQGQKAELAKNCFR